MGTSEQIQQSADATLALTALSTPLWLRIITEGLHLYVLIGGAVLLTLRVLKAIRDFKRKKDAS